MTNVVAFPGRTEIVWLDIVNHNRQIGPAYATEEEARANRPGVAGCYLCLCDLDTRRIVRDLGR